MIRVLEDLIVKDINDTNIDIEEKVKLMILYKNSSIMNGISYIDLGEELITRLLEKCPSFINKITQTPEHCLHAVKQEGRVLRYIKHKTPEICLEAVKNNGYALQFITEPTYEMCLEAVKNNGRAIQFIKEQTHELCLEAVKQTGNAIQFIKEQTHELCMIAVKNEPLVLKYVKVQTLEICLIAVVQKPYCVQCINPLIIEYFKEYYIQYLINISNKDDKLYDNKNIIRTLELLEITILDIVRIAHYDK